MKQKLLRFETDLNDEEETAESQMISQQLTM